MAWIAVFSIWLVSLQKSSNFLRKFLLSDDLSINNARFNFLSLSSSISLVSFFYANLLWKNTIGLREKYIMCVWVDGCLGWRVENEAGKSALKIFTTTKAYWVFTMYRSWAKGFTSDCILFSWHTVGYLLFALKSVPSPPLALLSIIGNNSSQVSLPNGYQWDWSKEDTGRGMKGGRGKKSGYFSLSPSVSDLYSSYFSFLAPAPPL